MGPAKLQTRHSKAMLQCLGDAPWGVCCPPLSNPNPRAVGVLMDPWASYVPCQMLQGAESLWTGSCGYPKGKTSVLEQAAAIPRQWHAPEASSQPSSGKPAMYREREVTAWALLQDQCSPCASTSLPEVALNAVWKISTYPLSSLWERSIGSGGWYLL